MDFGARIDVQSLFEISWRFSCELWSLGAALASRDSLRDGTAFARAVHEQWFQFRVRRFSGRIGRIVITE